MQIKKYLIGIAYVSCWVIIWGTIGSLIDFPLLKANIYEAGTIGQLTTFSISGIVAVILAILIYPKLIGNTLNQ